MNLFHQKKIHAEHIMRNTGMDEAQTGIKIAGRNINNLRYAMTPPYGRKQRGAKEPLDDGEREEETVSLILNTKKLRPWHPVPSLHGKWKGRKQKWCQILFSWAPKSLRMVTTAMKLKDTCSLEGKL